MNLSLNNYRAILLTTIFSALLSGCYHNSTYQPPGGEKDKPGQHGEVTQTRKKFCEQTPKPARCTADPDTFTDWGHPGVFTFMIFENKPISNGDQDLNSFLKIGNPQKAFRRYFDLINTDKYSLVFEMVDFDENSSATTQNVYLFLWNAEAIIGDQIYLKLNSHQQGVRPLYIYPATVIKKGKRLRLTTLPQTITLPTSTVDPKAPPLIFKDAVIDMKIHVAHTIGGISREPNMGFEGTIRGKLTKESYKKAVIYNGNPTLCNSDCIERISGDTCREGTNPNSCPSFCTELLAFCMSGDANLYNAFSYTVDEKPYSAATVSLSLLGIGINILGFK